MMWALLEVNYVYVNSFNAHIILLNFIITHFIRVLQRNINERMCMWVNVCGWVCIYMYVCMCVYKKIYFEVSSHVIMGGLVSSKSNGGGWQTWYSAKSCNLSPKAVCWGIGKSQCCRWKAKTVWWIPFWLGRGQPFIFLRPLIDWLRFVHLMENNLLYSV